MNELFIALARLGLALENQGNHLGDEFELLFAGDLGWNMDLDNAICPISLNTPLSPGAADDAKLWQVGQRIVFERWRPVSRDGAAS